ncbi:response regulator transcription factor [Paenibacillus hemerocallicola]|uniref:Response regulator transcription factor n=1 Tax=Paenibacillus hemerocallicola TaxID=1172614 RepID=A0A5C4TB49_9BACL|nr:response regulator transcription factor [Paenibacillus hemerocallicola]TNJ65669.1 response regulator transcription factor [Paenibacillus hemerocallicola]
MHILIVEDEPKIRDVLIAYFEKEGWKTDYTSNGMEAVQKFDFHQHDLIILDLMLEGLPGEEVCKRIREKSNVPIIMVTSKSREIDTINGLNLGADDYIVKPFRAKELIARIYALFRRIAPVKRENDDEKVIRFFGGKLVINMETREVLADGRPAPLTATEFKLLSVLIRKPGKVYSRADLSYTVQGYRFQGDGRAIDAHVKNLRKKIEPDPGAPLYIVTVVGTGYKFSMQPDEPE